MPNFPNYIKSRMNGGEKFCSGRWPQSAFFHRLQIPESFNQWHPLNLFNRHNIPSHNFNIDIAKNSSLRKEQATTPSSTLSDSHFVRYAFL